MGYVDKNGRIVIEAKQDALANNFSEGLAAVWSEDGTSYIDKTGKVVIEVPRPHGGPFSEGLAAILEEGKCFGYIDKTGKVVIELPSDYTGADFIGGFARVSRRDADGQTKWGFIDKTGKLIGPPNNDPNPPSPEP